MFITGGKFRLLLEKTGYYSKELWVNTELNSGVLHKKTCVIIAEKSYYYYIVVKKIYRKCYRANILSTLMLSSTNCQIQYSCIYVSNVSKCNDSNA